MQYSLVEVLKLTVFSMAVVFLILAGIMGLMMLVAKILGEEKRQETQSKPAAASKEQSAQELFAEDPLARVAAITALSEASEGEEDGKKFRIKSIKRLK